MLAGKDSSGGTARIQIVPDGSRAANFGFDVTPARLVSGLITERGVCPATRDGLAGLFQERAKA